MRVEVIDVINPGSVIHFNDVPEQETAVRAAAFRIYTCADATLHVSAGPTAPYQLLSSDPVRCRILPFNLMLKRVCGLSSPQQRARRAWLSQLEQ